MDLNQIFQSNKRCWLAISFFIFCLIQCYSQKQGNIWYFGGDFRNPTSGGAGLDFNNGSAISLINSGMPFTRGSASYCNSNGELLFYSNGTSVYDRTHHVMLDGNNLGEDSLTSQSVLIVPFTKDTNKYYVFTNSGAKSGLHYSIINMMLNNGLGGVVNPKAIKLLDRTGVQLTGCNHSNKNDFWVIISSPNDSSKLYAYQVTNQGINMPVVSTLNIGRFLPSNIEINAIGTKVALKIFVADQGFRYIINFDASTGAFSNPFEISKEPQKNVSYNTGCSFSPDGNLFYEVERHDLSGETYLFQYDLNAPNVKLSKTNISKINNNFPIDMQIGPDEKIYFGLNRTNYLDYIENPNLHGFSCNYKPNSIDLKGKYSGNLPNETLIIMKPTSTSSDLKNKPISMEYDYNSKQLKFIFSDENAYSLKLYGLQGQLLLNNEISDNAQVNISSLPIGLYIYSIETELKILQTGKILIY